MVKSSSVCIVDMINYAIYCILSYYAAAEHSAVPVIMSDHNKIINFQFTPNPFAVMPTSTFKDLVAEVTSKSKVILIFVEEFFCLEDISLKDYHGTPYFHLSQGIHDQCVKYFPSVVDPYKTLMNMYPHHDENVFHIRSLSYKTNLYGGKYPYYYIYFEDGFNETRSNALRRHDTIMREIYLNIHHESAGPLITFYTGKINPIVFGKMNFVPTIPDENPNEASGVLIRSYGALFRLAGVFTTMGYRRAMFDQTPEVTEETWEPGKLSTRIAYSEFELEFNFKFNDVEWKMDNVILLELGEEVGNTRMEACAPWDHSYECAQPLMVVNTRDGSIVTISQYQMQPFRSSEVFGENNATRSNNTNVTGFDSSVNCVRYFSASILAGLLVTFFCFAILVYGVLFLFGCKSNDRYDDAQGKTLTPPGEGH